MQFEECSDCSVWFAECEERQKGDLYTQSEVWEGKTQPMREFETKKIHKKNFIIVHP